MIANAQKITRLQSGTTDKCAVDIRLFEELTSVTRLDATAVEDANLLACIGVVGSQFGTQSSVNCLSIGRRCARAVIRGGNARG